MAHDIRAVANLILDFADQCDVVVSNLIINKVTFFVYSSYLVEFGVPMSSAKIEAWEYGPVFRELYQEFKMYGDGKIKHRASRISPTTGLTESCTSEFDELERAFIIEVAERFLRLSARALVALSHEQGAPWDQVWNHSTRSRASMKISDDLIREWYANSARH